MLKVYGDIQSGNCYKVKLLLALLNIEHQWCHIDILKQESQSPDYLAKNPNGKIPLLELDNGEFIAESNAILNYLADGTPLLPSDKLTRAKVLQWQFFEQYSHEPYIAVARFINKYLGLPEDRLADYHSKQAGGNKALSVMEQQLAQTPYLVGDSLTIADISLYGYTHVADEGGFDLSKYPAILRWINNIQAQKNYLSMNN
ncbi:glutathione S-transferase family protein [Thalassotalea agariperforans]